MRKDQHQPDFSPETEPRPSEAQMFAEILRRLDALDKQKARSGPAQPARTLDLVELFYYLLSKVHIILLGMIAGALLLGERMSPRGYLGCGLMLLAVALAQTGALLPGRKEKKHV